MPAKTTFQSIRVRGPASFDQAIRVKGVDWPPAAGVVPAHQHAAADITSGLLPDSRIASAAAWNAKGAPNAAAESVLAGNFTITAANNTYQSTGLSLDLPGAGTYLICGVVRGDLKMSAGTLAYLAARLFNVTDNAAVANTETMICLTETVNQNLQQSAAVLCVLTIAAPKTIALQALRNGSGVTFATSRIDSETAGRTRLAYLKVL